MSRRTIPVEFEELKDSGNLPSPAGVGLRVLEITRTDDYSAEDMGEAIMSDPALTGRILELANSAERAGQESITTVSGAIMRLGATTVRNLALAFSLVSEREAGSCRPFDYERYWSLCLARAVAAKAISVEIENITPEEAYVAGLLGEIGILALASVHSERYGRLLVEYEGRSLGSIRDAELAAFDIDHPTIGECMLRDWGLPESFGAAVADFCVKRAVTPVTARLESLADLLRFADVIASALLFGEDSPPEHVTEVGESLDCVRDVLAYEAPEFDRMCDAISHEWRSWGERLEITTRDVRFSRVRKEIAEGRERYAEEKRARATGRATRRKPTLLPPEPRSPVVDDEERISILAVDDDPVSLRILVRFLRRARFDVTMARSGKEGLKKALQEKPDLIIVDYEMPGMSGLDVVKALRRSSLGSSLYILLLTGNDEDELLVDAFDAGVDDFVNKPFQPRVLTARMQAGIRIARLQRKVDRDRRTILKQLAEKNALNRKLRTASLTDSLTGLANRRHAMNRIETEWMSSERTGSPFSRGNGTHSLCRAKAAGIFRKTVNLR
ncbi:MAG: HDOD domain-containing protein, partial [Planctomycetota bacterium]